MPPEHAAADARAHSPATPLAALWRLRSYLRPYLWRLIGMLAAACASVATALMIPLLTKALIDSAISTGDRSLLLPIGLAATGLGIAQAALNFTRRWVQASAVTGMEQAMRRDLYAHLQRLDIGFHDEWQTGQLLSRATTDLSAIRRFAGFGTVFLITNVVTFVAVIALLIHLNWWLGLITGGIFLPVGLVSSRFERRYRVLSRRAQDQQGDLATYVEEAATGIAVLKALGRRAQAQARHGAQASACLPDPARQGTAARLVLGHARPHPEHRHRADRATRRHRDQPARADARRPGRVHHAHPGAGLADRGDGLHPGERPGGRHRGAARVRDPRHPARRGQASPPRSPRPRPAGPTAR